MKQDRVVSLPPCPAPIRRMRPRREGISELIQLEGDRDPSQGGHVGQDASAEALLVGDVAAKVTAAVEAEYPDATIDRMENDAEGSAYEAHIAQADGRRATVKLDQSYPITSTETGH
ncbi:MAG: hypothetical protein JWQ68_1838 [Cryobacterium sp.]|nr:hypothetical protein [Cryobacterium sp.]